MIAIVCAASSCRSLISTGAQAGAGDHRDLPGSPDALTLWDSLMWRNWSPIDLSDVSRVCPVQLSPTLSYYKYYSQHQRAETDWASPLTFLTVCPADTHGAFLRMSKRDGPDRQGVWKISHINVRILWWETITSYTSRDGNIIKLLLQSKTVNNYI